MRIALSNPDVNLTGGIERVVVEASNRLTRLGHTVTLYAARVEASTLDPRVEVRHVGVPLQLDARVGIGFRRRCRAAIRAGGHDVHGAFGVLSPVFGVFWVPSVHKVGYDLLRSRRGARGRLRLALHPYHRVRLALEQTMFAPDADLVILAQTQEVRSEIMSSYARVENDVRVLNYGYDSAAFNPDRRVAAREDARRRFGFAADEPVFLFVANELERKGFDVLVAAAGRMPEARILGAGRQPPSARMVERLGLGDRLQWAGRVRDVPSLHAAADALVLPTRYEPWGLVIVEALGSGLPVVTTRLAGAAAAVREGITGRLLEDPEDVEGLADAMRWAVSGAPATPQEIADSVQDYSWDRVIGRYEQVLSAAADGR